jgi:type II secretory pathway pseudopilin PulG
MRNSFSLKNNRSLRQGSQSELTAGNAIAGQAGMSLVAVMVAVAILGILGFVLSEVFSNQFNAQKQLDLQVARMAIIRNLNARIQEYCPNPDPARAWTWIPASCDPPQYLEIPSAAGPVIVSKFDPSAPLNAQLMGEMRIRAKCIKVNGAKQLKVEAVDAKKLAAEPSIDRNWKDISPQIALNCDINNR